MSKHKAPVPSKFIESPFFGTVLTLEYLKKVDPQLYESVMKLPDRKQEAIDLVEQLGEDRWMFLQKGGVDYYRKPYSSGFTLKFYEYRTKHHETTKRNG